MLLDIAALLTKVVLIILIILGIIGNSLNLLIFTRPSLLRSPCTLYFLAASIDNILVIFTSLLTRLLANGFSYDIASLSNLACKLRYYPGYIFFSLSPYFYILACFDRYCSSSISATRRSWSDQKFAKRCIIGASILACIVYLHLAIFYELQLTNTGFRCNSRPGVYTTLWRFFYLIIYCILPAFLMGLLSLLILINIQHQARRIEPVLRIGNDGRRRRLNHQMIRMLLSLVLTQVLCILPTAIINLLILFIDTSTILFSFFQQILILPLYVNYTASFYIFTMSSRIYRQELVKIL